MQLIEVFIAALVQTYTKWTGVPVLFLMLTDHGRSIFPELDVSRTVGVFAQSKWLFLDLRKCSGVKEILQETKRQIHATPNRGFDLEFAYYHMQDTEQVRQINDLLIKYQIQLNFISSLPRSLKNSSELEDKRIFRLTDGNVAVPEIEGTYTSKRLPLYCHSTVLPNEVRLSWKYDESAYQQSTIEKLAQYYIESLQEFARASYQ
jgi:hypothetical protein